MSRLCFVKLAPAAAQVVLIEVLLALGQTIVFVSPGPLAVSEGERC